MTVLIYQDYVHNNGLLLRALGEHFGTNYVRFCDADDIRDGILDTALLFVMPGGADLYYCEKLNGAGNAAIRTWVEGGGTYLGICAGAYYACARLQWAQGEHEISGNRELGFFSGTATGPVYSLIENSDITHSWLAAPALQWNDGTTRLETIVCYEAGPVFSEGGATVLARYTGLSGAPPAIIECSVGKGRAILSSPHLERTPAMMAKALYSHRNSSHEWDKAIIKKAEDYRDETVRLRALVFNRAIRADSTACAMKY